MTTKSASKPDLHVVPAAEPDLSELERVLTETAQLSAPMIGRASSTRQRMALERQKLVDARAEKIAERDLMRRQVEAAERALDAIIADYDETIALYSGVPEQG